MRRIFGSLLIVCGLLSNFARAAPVEATTREGKSVLLFEDGTWKYKAQDPSSPSASAFTKSQGATSVVRSQKGFLEIWYNPNSWVTPGGIDNSSAEFTFKHTSGDAYAMVVVERLNIPLQTLRQLGVDNAKKVAPDAKVVMEEERTVNGLKVLALQMEATTKGIPVKYFNYYWAGKAGSVQLVTFTGQNLFVEYSKDMLDLLNGLVVTQLE